MNKSIGLKFKKHGLKIGALSFAALAMIITMQNCSNVNLARIPGEVVQPSVIEDPPPRLEPVLATRNPACLMCHAQINGDMITDVGVGSPFVMGTDAVANHPGQTSYYGPFQSKHFIWGQDTWNGSAVMGNIYVPDYKITDARLIAAYVDPAAGNAPLSGPLKLLDFLKGSFKYPGTSTVLKVLNSSTSQDINVPGLRGKFISRKSIWIDAPSGDEIRSLMQAPGAQVVKAELGAVLAKNSASDTIIGLKTKTGMNTGKRYFTNETVTTCKGDIIIDGILFLNNLILNTDDKGCRLYVTGSVFIQGPIVYPMGGESNLQISSASIISMGIKTLEERLANAVTSASLGGLRMAPTDYAELAANQKILDDVLSIDGLTNDAGPYELMLNMAGTAIGTMDSIVDKQWQALPGNTIPANPVCREVSTVQEAAAAFPAGINCNQMQSGRYPTPYQFRKAMEYEHLLLNAPRIHSRYYGIFKGVIIGEDVLFAVNNFKFEKDPVMIDVNLLPLLNERVFKMSAE